MKNISHKEVIPPDGGWGWVIVIANGLNFFFVFSVIQSFGLIYRNEFVRLGFTGTQSSLILTTNGSLSMLCGLVNGYLLKRFSARKISVVSAIITVSGLIMTAFSTNFMHFLISYGIVTSIGVGMSMSSYSLAINMYFKKKRSQAVGTAITISGTGVIIFPQLVSHLLANYTIRDTMLIISALYAHTLASALLLQPVEWHTKSINKEEHDEDEGLFTPKIQKTDKIITTHNDTVSLHASMISLNNQSDGNPEATVSNKIYPSKGFFNTIIKMFDLSLLKDLVFVNILLGLSIEYFADFTFIWLIPFVLIEIGLSIKEAATFISVYSIADLCFKFLAPYIASVLKQPSRNMLLVSLVLVVSVRMFLAFISNYTFLLILAVGIGSCRGMRLIYWQLVIPEYVSIEHLAGALGLLFTLNGICMIIGGPILGAMREQSGSYKSCVILLNCITIGTVIMWTTQIVYEKMKPRGKQQIDNEME